MTIFLSEDSPPVCFVGGGQLFVNSTELRDLLRSNGTEHSASGDWKQCLPTYFGYGLCADWLEDKWDSLLPLCTFFLFDSHLGPEEILRAVIDQFRNNFKVLAEDGH